MASLLLSMAPASSLLLSRDSPPPREIASPALHRLRGGQLIANGELVPIVSKFELDALLEEAGGRLVVVDFYADWCGPCKRIAPVLHGLARKAGSKVVFAKVDVDEAKELASLRGVKSMPTIQFFRNGKQVHQIIGANQAQLEQLVTRAMAHPLFRLLTSDRLLSGAALFYLLVFANPLKQPA